MDTFTFYTAIIFFSLLSFIIGGIYTDMKTKKLKEQLDKEVRNFNRQLGLLNNSVYGNLENNCQGSIERRLAQLELNIDTHSDLLNEHMDAINHHKDIINMSAHNIANMQARMNDYSDAINKLARHTEYPKSKIV